MRRKKKIVIFIFILLIIAGLGSYFIFFKNEKNKNKEGINIIGDVTINYQNDKKELMINSDSLLPTGEARLLNDNYLTFTIKGNNTSNQDINYEIDIIHGEGLTGKLRFKDEDLLFDLEEIIDGESKLVVDAGSYEDLSKKVSMWVNNIEANTKEIINRTYKLRMWLSNDILVSDTSGAAKYTTAAFKNSFGSIKVNVHGDYQEKTYVDTTTFAKSLFNNATLDNGKSEFVSNSDGIDFGKESSNDNGKGLYILSSTKEDRNPIVYYRGDITNNNLIFAGFCWQIIRTTNNGGIKLIYNGEAVDNTCDVENKVISNSAYNSNSDSLAYVGYMYGDVYQVNYGTMETGSLTGSNFTYKDNKYTLTNTSNTLDETHHYTCNNKEGNCEVIRYYYNSNYYLTLTNGKNIDDAILDMRSNSKSSLIKETIDTWFETHLNKYLDKIEDSIYCNDRELTMDDKNGFVASGGKLDNYLYFASYTRENKTYKPDLNCSKVDSFSVGEQGNGALTYPVGLLTIDELMLAGANSYLKSDDNYWLMTPTLFNENSSFVRSIGIETNNSVNNSFGVRPVITLKENIDISSGDGTITTPYLVK